MRCWLVLQILAAGAAGCAGPEVTLTYTFPADLPVPAGGRVHLAGVTVAGAPGQPYGAPAMEALTRRLNASRRFGLAPSAGQAQMAVSATLHLTACDARNARAIRRYDPQRRTTERVRVPTLVRTASARMVFAVTEPATGRQLASAETRSRYSSAEDPRTRGALGLFRPDEPARVPPIHTIYRELIDDCVGTFWDMLQPRQVRVTVILRPTLNPHGAKGIAAAEAGEFARAARHFADAAASEPRNPDLLLNRAVCAEKAGQLATALAAYERLIQLRRAHQLPAHAGARRVKRVLGQQ
ncbi:MAG: hypothetical protein ACYS5V_10735 [Planctomycetota bacterium]|jgi:tetratricopeptide (TPR) repeat protein